MAVDKQDLIDVLFPGAGVSPACSIAPPGTPWRDDSVTCAPFDVDGANAKLDTNGPLTRTPACARTRTATTEFASSCAPRPATRPA